MIQTINSRETIRINNISIFYITIFSFILLFASSSAISDSQNKLKIGDKAPTFYLKDIEGQDFYLNDYCGEKLHRPWINNKKYVVIISFFATWCKPCHEEIQILQKIYKQEQRDSLKVLLIDVAESKETVKSYIKKRNITFPVLFDKYKIVAENYFVTSLPNLFIIDKSGIIRMTKVGFANGKNFELQLIKLINELSEDKDQQQNTK